MLVDPSAALHIPAEKDLATQSSGPGVTGRIHAAFSLLFGPATPPASSQNARLVGARGKPEDTHRETKRTCGLAVFPAPDIERRTVFVGGPPSNLPVPLAARMGQLVLSAILTDDPLSGYF
ncbi:Hypothetical protein SMAX5B_018029 [Scophthalmus maximus]|uniref:Uncharacterized protein n=1 Tax=Scophthalmus maximus TaxID=52904 RepID=A0A2U9CEN5_SCOMX|nr:Hypothetical protein SMAX5B_018029 [Scophthalmus maximus]